MAEALRAQGDLPRALRNQQAALSIRQKLAAADPQHGASQIELVGNLLGVGDIQSAQDDLPAAQSSYQQALTLWQSLLRAEPGSAVMARNLVWTHWLIGSLEGSGLAQRERMTALQTGSQLLNRLKTQGQLTPAQDDWPRRFKQAIAAAQRQP